MGQVTPFDSPPGLATTRDAPKFRSAGGPVRPSPNLDKVSSPPNRDGPAWRIEGVAIDVTRNDLSRLLGGREAEARQAFSESVRPVLPAMARVAARLAVGIDSDEVVQEALVRAWQKRDTFDPRRGSFDTWLLAITADKARRARQRRTLAPALAPTAPLPQLSEARLDPEAAVGHLAPRQRLAINCFYFADLSVAQTAAAMGCSKGTVKSTLSDARARLRQLLAVSDDAI